ncbi:hypothetical protein BDFB_005302 [Asbolus verrucosus]|uniref:Chitin-binding type-2 domain-containing protein n=1 Tax=Asbolus verrucosus TaxID=1661398 RepID=A0A482VDE6_ASBVE|nr:hypothetical protein BDFB_005302 [Asbolus verrucosus]
MCDGLGRQFSYTCPNATLFQQRMLICDHWYMVNCSKSEDDYAANLRIGQREMPFVDDSESNPYHRTPRPDLLSHPSQSEYDIIYRTGKAQLANNLNLVGVESDSKNSTTSTTDEPAYSLPSHWSTEYSQQPTTDKSIVKDKLTNVLNTKKNLENSSTIKGKPIIGFNAATESPPVNYKSYYKNTTPVFPKTVELTTAAPDDLGLLPPLPYQLLNASKDTTLVTTTEIPVNFKSEFKATTPVYPKTVDATSEEPGDLGILPPTGPNSTNETQKTPPLILNLEIEPPVASPKSQPLNRSQDDSDVSSPSKFYQPPKFEPDYTEVSSENDKGKKGVFKSLNNNEWEDLRKKFLIPDYEFPLESVSRPSYDSVLSSFQVSPGFPEK